MLITLAFSLFQAKFPEAFSLIHPTSIVLSANNPLCWDCHANLDFLSSLCGME